MTEFDNIFTFVTILNKDMDDKMLLGGGSEFRERGSLFKQMGEMKKKIQVPSMYSS